MAEIICFTTRRKLKSNSNYSTAYRQYLDSLDMLDLLHVMTVFQTARSHEELTLERYDHGTLILGAVQGRCQTNEMRKLVGTMIENLNFEWEHLSHA